MIYCYTFPSHLHQIYSVFYAQQQHICCFFFADDCTDHVKNSICFFVCVSSRSFFDYRQYHDMRKWEKRREERNSENYYYNFKRELIVDVQESVAVQIKFCFSSRRDFEGIGWESRKLSCK